MSLRVPMPKPSRVLLAMAFTLLCVLVSLRPSGQAAPTPDPASTPVLGASGLENEQREGRKLGDKIAQSIGPLAPIALSPFFGLACLSGASLLADSGLPIVDRLGKNAVLGEDSPLHNPVVFAGFLLLTVLTSLPKFTKVSKPLGQAIDQLEAHAGIISVVLVQYLSTINFGADEPEAAAIVLQAGIFSFTADVLIAVFSAINIFVVNTVKFFFEVLTWLSPFPAVDAAFETANKAFAAFLLAVYVWSPWAGLMLNLLIFGICLIIFAWVYRRVVYMRSVLGDPVLGWLAEKLFRRPPATLTSTPLPSAIARALPNPKLVLKAFAGKAMPEVKRKMRGYLVCNERGLSFAIPRLFRSPIIVPLDTRANAPVLDEGLLSNTIEVTAANGDTTARFLITRRYNALLTSIREQLGATVGQTPHATTVATEARALDASRAVGAAVKAGEARAELRQEFA